MTRPFICDKMSRSCGAGSVDSVRDIASGQVRFGGKSTPGGSGANVLDGCACAGSGCCPFMGCVVFWFCCWPWFDGALSPAPLSFDQSTRNFLPIIS